MLVLRIGVGLLRARAFLLENGVLEPLERVWVVGMVAVLAVALLRLLRALMVTLSIIDLARPRFVFTIKG